jgi:hypothetical protein
MTQADRVLSTPPTNTSANNQSTFSPDPTRRRFLAVASITSIVGAGGLAVAAATPASVPQVITIPQACPELRATIRHLELAHGRLKIAQADHEEAQAILTDWEAQHPKPASKRGMRRWNRRADAQRLALLSTPWQALLDAEQAFERDQHGLAAVPITGPGDIAALAAATIIFDVVELHTNIRAPIARAVAAQVFKQQGKAVLS